LVEFCIFSADAETFMLKISPARRVKTPGVKNKKRGQARQALSKTPAWALTRRARGGNIGGNEVSETGSIKKQGEYLDDKSTEI
jgi:hypothetical protein